MAEMAILIAFPIATSLVTLVALWRLYRTLFVLLPARAISRGSSYSDAERAQDNIGVINWGQVRLAPMEQGEGYAEHAVNNYLRFTDRDGNQHDVTVTQRLQIGKAPDADCTVWYDPAKPSRVTRYGPFFWAMVAATALGLTIWFFTMGPSADVALH